MYVVAQTIRSPQSMLLTKIWSIVAVAVAAVAASAVVEHVVAAAAVILIISVTYVST